jgi:hypothetical protein
MSGNEIVPGLPDFETGPTGCIAPRPHSLTVMHRRHGPALSSAGRADPRDPIERTRPARRDVVPVTRPGVTPKPGQEDEP